MAVVTLKGNKISTCGSLPEKGQKAPAFKLTKGDLSDVGLKDFSGKVLILNIVPSLDTGTCAASARTFNKRAAELGNALVLTISRDLPFAQKRFCEAEGIAAVVPLSELRNRDFGKDYGVELIDGPLAGLLARSIVVLDSKGSVTYTELVPEIAQEPNYDAAIAAAKKAS